MDGSTMEPHAPATASKGGLHTPRTPRTVLTFGTFDLFHLGHLRILERSAALGDRLLVGVSTDALNFSKKGRFPFVPEEDRMAIIAALRCVDGVFREESLEKKRDYLVQHKADVLVMGHDWKGRFDEFRDVCEVVYLPRTDSVSTTEIESLIRNRPSPRHQVRQGDRPA
ncbi:MAG: choline-phosphate cytidylyltransferase [Thermoplasmata archaeon]|nr:choline-phosphate cytidylyltransferase [Thermoplasmata archaeon]